MPASSRVAWSRFHRATGTPSPARIQRDQPAGPEPLRRGIARDLGQRGHVLDRARRRASRAGRPARTPAGPAPPARGCRTGGRSGTGRRPGCTRRRRSRESPAPRARRRRSARSTASASDSAEPSRRERKSWSCGIQTVAVLPREAADALHVGGRGVPAVGLDQRGQREREGRVQLHRAGEERRGVLEGARR